MVGRKYCIVDVKSYNGLSSELSIFLNFMEKYYIRYRIVLYTSYKLMADKQTYFENHRHQKNVYQENNLNQMFLIFLFFFIF